MARDRDRDREHGEGEAAAKRPRATPEELAASAHPLNSTRISRVWLATGVALVLLLLAGIFIGQNGDEAQLEFLFWEWSAPIGLALLFSAVAGGLIVGALATARIIQLRRTATHHEVAVHHEPDRADAAPEERAGNLPESSTD